MKLFQMDSLGNMALVSHKIKEPISDSRFMEVVSLLKHVSTCSVAIVAIVTHGGLGMLFVACMALMYGTALMLREGTI